MTCKDCLNAEFCRNNADDYTDSYTDETLENNVEKLCNGFKNKNKFIELPCNIGDNLYDIEEFVEHIPHAELYTVKADSINIGQLPSGKIYFNIYDFEFSLDDIGKTVFLTEEAAEQAVKELN